jgi:hypothetical protein
LSKSDQTWEGTNLSKDKWQEFEKSDIWRAFLFELESREKYLIELFKEGDKEWTPDVIRGKMTEIDFVKQIPALIILSIIDKEKTEKEIRDGNEDGRRTVGILG